MLPQSPEIPSVIPFTDILLHNNRDKIEHKICNSNTKENFVRMYYYHPPGLRFGLVAKNSFFSHCNCLVWQHHQTIGQTVEMTLCTPLKAIVRNSTGSVSNLLYELVSLFTSSPTCFFI